VRKVEPRTEGSKHPSGVIRALWRSLLSRPPRLVQYVSARHAYAVSRAFALLLTLVIVGFIAPMTALAKKSSLPALSANGIGSVHFGAPEASAVASLRKSLGAPNATGINTGCRPSFTEIAWRDLIVEFKHDRFTGYRFIRGGWPLTTAGSPHDLVTSGSPTPRLKTAVGITLGSTLGELGAPTAR
jgi:hypothetical protein